MNKLMKLYRGKEIKDILKDYMDLEKLMKLAFYMIMIIIMMKFKFKFLKYYY